MKSAQTMLAPTSALPGLGAVLALALLPACETLPGRRPELTPPTPTVAPYDASRGEVLWAVLPLANESGTEIFDPLAISDQLVAAAEEVEGVRTVPLNRTLQAMHALGVRAIEGPGDVERLALAMGVDGILLGSITAYDPYSPPTIGLSLALYARGGAMAGVDPSPTVDPRALTAAPTDATPVPLTADRPAAVVSAHLDARDHGVLTAVQSYAAGRHEPDSALGWRRYTASMDLYTQFATQHLVSALVQKEHERLAALQERNEAPAP